MQYTETKELAEKLEAVLLKVKISGELSEHSLNQLKEIHTKLASVEKDVGTFVLEDVMHQAKTRDIYLTEEQGKEILDLMEHRMDASVGMNWDVIDILTDEYLREEGENS